MYSIRIKTKTETEADNGDISGLMASENAMFICSYFAWFHDYSRRMYLAEKRSSVPREVAQIFILYKWEEQLTQIYTYERIADANRTLHSVIT